MQAIEPLPARVGLNGQTLRNIPGRFAELARELLDRVGENAQFMEKARAVAKEHAVKDGIPRGGAATRVTPEKGRVERFDHRKPAETSPAQRKRFAQRRQSPRQRLEQFASDGNLLPGADQLSPTS